MAQLGARLHGMQKVTSSSLVGSSFELPPMAEDSLINQVTSGLQVISRLRTKIMTSNGNQVG